MIEKDGWFLARSKGSHRQYKHMKKSGVVTIAGKENKDIHPKTLRSIIKQAQLS